jgi:DNA topoisomerase-1
MKLRHALCTLEPKYKKKAKYATAESDLEDEWVAAHEDELETKELEKAEKKFEKENEKRAADGEAAQPRSELDARLATIREDAKRLRKERGTGKATLKRERPVEKLEEAIAKLEERIATAGLQMVDREEGKEVALTTRFVRAGCWPGTRG